MTKTREARAVPWTGVVLLAVSLLFFARMIERVDPDVFFHLKEGGRVLAGRLPLVEDYSYTRAGKAMVATEWLSGAIFAAFFRVGGYPLLAAFNALLLAGALWLTARAGDAVDPALGALSAAATAFGLLNFALAKVQNFTFFFFALFLYWARQWGRGRTWAPWAMAAALPFWINLHGGFLLGWVLLGAVCGRDLLESRRPRALAPWLLGTLGCFLHPNGATAFVYPIWFFFAAPAGRSVILEWRPLAVEWSASPYFILLLLLLASRPWRLKGRVPWAAMAFVFLVLGLRTRKMLPFFVMSAGVSVGLAWGKERLSKTWSRAAAVAAGGLLAATFFVILGEARARAWTGPVWDMEREYPLVAAEKALELYPGRRLFHPYDWGGYLVYKIAPKVPIFIDGRLDPYWTLLNDYQTLADARPGWEKLVAAYGIETALLPEGMPLARAFDASRSWKRVGSDGKAILYSRVDSPRGESGAR